MLHFSTLVVQLLMQSVWRISVLLPALQRLKEGRSMTGLLFAIHRSILLLKLDYDRLSDTVPPTCLMRKPLYQLGPEISVFSSPQCTQRTEHIAWHPVTMLQQTSGCSPGIYVYVPSSELMLASTEFYCCQLFVCVCIHSWPLHWWILHRGLSTWCRTEQLSALFLLLQVFDAHCRRKQRPRRRLWGGTSSLFLCLPTAQSKPVDSRGEAPAEQKRSFKQGVGWRGNKAASSRTIL